MNESDIYNKLESLRNIYLENPKSILGNVEVEFLGKQFHQRIWSESHEKGELVVFLLESKNILTSKAYCIGLLVSKTGETEHLGNEQLWGLGIP